MVEDGKNVDFVLTGPVINRVRELAHRRTAKVSFYARKLARLQENPV
jgi:hypothetical protein